MPTYEQTTAFLRDFDRLTRSQQERFLTAVYLFIADLVAMDAGRKDRFRPGLRVKRMRGVPGLFEMTWAPNGRATFSWGEPVTVGKRHVVWERCGDHGGQAFVLDSAYGVFWGRVV